MVGVDASEGVTDLLKHGLLGGADLKKGLVVGDLGVGVVGPILDVPDGDLQGEADAPAFVDRVQGVLDGVGAGAADDVDDMDVLIVQGVAVVDELVAGDTGGPVGSLEIEGGEELVLVVLHVEALVLEGPIELADVGVTFSGRLDGLAQGGNREAKGGLGLVGGVDGDGPIRSHLLQGEKLLEVVLGGLDGGQGLDDLALLGGYFRLGGEDVDGGEGADLNLFLVHGQKVFGDLEGLLLDLEVHLGVDKVPISLFNGVDRVGDGFLQGGRGLLFAVGRDQDLPLRGGQTEPFQEGLGEIRLQDGVVVGVVGGETAVTLVPDAVEADGQVPAQGDLLAQPDGVGVAL